MAVERRAGQRGETLIESLLAILILSLVAVAAYQGLRTSLRVSVQHRESAVAETMLRTAAERLQDPASAYVPRAGCAGAGTYTDLPTRSRWDPIDVDVRFWVAPTSVSDAQLVTTFAAPGTCPSIDPGLQQIDLTITTPAGFTETLQIVKRVN